MLDAALAVTRAPDGSMLAATMAGWAVFAYRAALLLHGDHHEKTAAAAQVLAQAIDERAGRPVAISLRRTVVALHTRAGRHLDLAPARLDLAAALQHDGACEAAAREAIGALHQWTALEPDQPGISTGLLLAALSTLDLCGRLDDAQALLHIYTPLLAELNNVEREHAAWSGRSRLGDIDLIRAHLPVCVGRPDAAGSGYRKRRPATHRLRQAFLRALTGDPHFGDPNGPPPRWPTRPGR